MFGESWKGFEAGEGLEGDDHRGERGSDVAGGVESRPRLSGCGPQPKGQAIGRLPSTETQFTPEQRLLVLDAWRRSGLPAGDFAPLVGISKHTLYA